MTAPVSNYAETFAELKALFAPYESRLNVKADDLKSYLLEGEYSDRWKRSAFFGGVRLGKTYASFYLMPIYTHPVLIKDLSPALLKKMQGKSCFSFKRVEPALFEELAELTKAAFEVYAREGQVRK